MYLNETDISKTKVWYHVTSQYFGNSFTFTPHIPQNSRLKGEDKKTPRICVSPRWQSPIYMLALIRPNRYWWIYKTEEIPIDPVSTREKLLKDKKIKKVSNDYRSLDAEKHNSEAWFLKPTNMEFWKCADLGKDRTLWLMMGNGNIDFDEVKLLSKSEYDFQIKSKSRIKGAETL